jgi:hypothetical protein
MKPLIQSYLEFFNTPFTGLKRDLTGIELLPDHSEFAGAPQVSWTPKPSFKKFPSRDQSSSYSCVFQSNAKARGATYANQGGNFPILSALPYNKRSNFPDAGAIPYEGLQITAQGLPLESVYPSQKMNEAQMNAAAKPAVDPNYAGTTPVRLALDMDTIASVIDQGYGVVICNNFATVEYAQYVPVTYRGVFRGIDHQIAGVDRTLYNGSKALVCEDSAFLNSAQDGQRIITEDFLLNHTFFVGYVRNVTPPKFQAIPKPDHIFTVDMQLGQTSNEIKLLQQRMIYEGYLSPDCATGYFGSLTKKAVIAYQQAKMLPNTGYVGSMTRSSLNTT